MITKNYNKMGLSFLNKKQWHPGSFGNIEKVWIAEQKQRERERKQIENAKKLKEERQIEELKKLQVEAGLIPESHLYRMDWIYQGPESSNGAKTAEEILKREENKKRATPTFQESYSNPKNEEFTKSYEDPLFAIKAQELKKRKEIEENPYVMKRMLKKIEDQIIKQEKKEKHKSRKHKDKSRKKEKREKDSKRERSRESSLILNKDNDLKYGLDEKTPVDTKIRRTNKLGIDEEIYNSKMRQLDKEKEYYRNKESSRNHYRRDKLTEEEKRKKVEEMEERARRHSRTYSRYHDSRKDPYRADEEQIEHEYKPKFMRDTERNLYTGDLTLSERINRNKHYIAKSDK